MQYFEQSGKVYILYDTCERKALYGKRQDQCDFTTNRSTHSYYIYMD